MLLVGPSRCSPQCHGSETFCNGLSPPRQQRRRRGSDTFMRSSIPRRRRTMGAMDGSSVARQPPPPDAPFRCAGARRRRPREPSSGDRSGADEDLALSLGLAGLRLDEPPAKRACLVAPVLRAAPPRTPARPKSSLRARLFGGTSTDLDAMCRTRTGSSPEPTPPSERRCLRSDFTFGEDGLSSAEAAATRVGARGPLERAAESSRLLIFEED